MRHSTRDSTLLQHTLRHTHDRVNVMFLPLFVSSHLQLRPQRHLEVVAKSELRPEDNLKEEGGEGGEGREEEGEEKRQKEGGEKGGDKEGKEEGEEEGEEEGHARCVPYVCMSS